MRSAHKALLLLRRLGTMRFPAPAADASAQFADGPDAACLAHAGSVLGAMRAATGNGVAAGSSAPSIANVRQVDPPASTALQLLVTVELNGSLRVPFRIDTGSITSGIPRRLADALGLRTGAFTRVPGASGDSVARWVTLDRVSASGASAEGVEMVVSDELEIGVLGMSFLRHFRMTADLAAGTVRLERAHRTDGTDGTDERSRRTGHFLRWGRVPGAVAYEVEVSRDPVFVRGTERGSATDTRSELGELISRSLAPGKYFWRVAAVGAAGVRGPWSAASSLLYL